MDNALLELGSSFLAPGTPEKIIIYSTGVHPEMTNHEFQTLANWLRLQDGAKTLEWRCLHLLVAVDHRLLQGR